MRSRYLVGLVLLCVLLIGMLSLLCKATDETSKSSREQEIEVFNVPLGGSPQAVLDALKKSNVKLHGLISTDSYTSEIGSLEKCLLQGRLLSEPSDREEAIKTLNEKVRRFSVKYEGGEMCLAPTFLSGHLGVEVLVNPLFSKDYAAYNSQFALYTSFSDNPSVSTEMLGSGIQGIQITFASLKQQEPVAFMISLEVHDNKGLYEVLIRKYGKPKRYCVVPDGVENPDGVEKLVREKLANDTNAEFVAVKPSAEEGACYLGSTFQELPHPDLFRPSNCDVDVRRPFTVKTCIHYGPRIWEKGQSSQEPYLIAGTVAAFVWRVGDAVIIWSGDVEFTDAPPRSGQLVYLKFPILIELEKAYADLGADLTKYAEELKEKGKTKF